MNKIGTHNSATGERAGNILSFLLTPFARCQSKTIAEQYEAGCRYFDLRVDKDMRLCHGIWKSSVTLEHVLAKLCFINGVMPQPIYVMVTYEGSLNVYEEARFEEQIRNIVNGYYNGGIVLTAINVKKPIWRCVWSSVNAPQTVSKFKNLDGSTWHTYLPIPWLWKKLYYNKPEFNEREYTLVDFL